jgi:hypothetical protein
MNCYVLQMTEEQQPIFVRSPKSPSYMIGEEGENILCITKPTRVIIPLFSVSFEAESGSFQQAQKFLTERALAIRGTVKDIFEGSLVGYDPAKFSLVTVLDHQGVSLLKDGFTVKVGIAAVHLDYFPGASKTSSTEVTKLTAAYQTKLWSYEGKCPHCGETGRLDPCGGALCTRHGFYHLQLVPKPEPEFESVFQADQKFPFEQAHLVNDNMGAAYYSDLLFGTPLAFPTAPSA